MTTATTPRLKRGGIAAAERHEAEKSSRKKSFNKDWEYLQLAAPDEGVREGGSVFVRLVTDEQDFVSAGVHSFVDTKPAPADYPSDKRWPSKMGAVCRRSVELDDCYICEADRFLVEGKKGKYHPRPGLRIWAVAVEREPLIGTEEMADAGEIEKYEVGSPIGFKDVLLDREELDADGKSTGKTIQVKKFLILNYALENFFNHFLGFKNGYGTVVDRDYKITRIGRGTDTEYEIVPQDKMRVAGKVFDLRNPTFADEYKIPFDLEEIVLEQASDGYYEWFFDDRVTSSYTERFGKKDSSDNDSVKEAKADESAHKDAVAKMRERFARAQED